MKKSLTIGITVVLGLATVITAPSASAYNLSITTGTHTCLAGTDAAQPTGCQFNAATTSGGSYFSMNGDFANSMSSNVGLEVGPGTAQPFVGAAPSIGSPLDPNPGTNPGIEQNITGPWTHIGITQYGVNYSVSDILLTDTGVGTAAADMRGWRVAWNEDAIIDLGSGLFGEGAPGALIYDGANWILDYSIIIPLGDPSGFGGATYDLHLEGTYTGDITMVIAAPAAVPVPAAVWLFSSGLIGLIGVARRRQLRV